MYFKEFEILTQPTMDSLWSVVNNASPTDWYRVVSHLEWTLRIPASIFDDNPRTKMLIDNFVEPDRLYIQRLEPNTSYYWHRDYDRNVAMTLGLNCFSDSYTLFGERLNFSLGPGHIPNIKPLKYNPNTMYLFNSAMWHTGINLSNEMRYLVSISFTKPFSMNDAIKFLDEHPPHQIKLDK
jgi:hypothetical protein